MSPLCNIPSSGGDWGGLNRQLIVINGEQTHTVLMAFYMAFNGEQEH